MSREPYMGISIDEYNGLIKERDDARRERDELRTELRTAYDLLRMELEDEKDDHVRDNRDNHGTIAGLRREIAELKRLRGNETQRTLTAMAQADDLLQRFDAMERERDHARAGAVLDEGP